MPSGTSTAQIDPFTPEGAQAISTIAGQQPAASVPASVLSTPTMPSLPQPAPTPLPSAPSIPSIDSIFNTPTTPLDTQFNNANENEANLEGQAAGQAEFQDQQEAAAGIPGLKSTVTDLTTQLNNLKTAAQQIPLSLQQNATGRGITTAGLQPIQDAQTRQNTIQQLGISAMLNAANGNLASAQDQVDAAVKAKFDPIQAEIDAQKAQLTALTPLMDAEEKKQAAEQQAQLQDRQDQITQQQDDQKTIYSTMLAAAQNGADSVTLRNIQNATTPDAAITAAGNFLNTPKTQAVNANGHVLLIDSTTGKTIADLGESDAAMSLAAKNATDPSQLIPYLSTTSSGAKYVDLSSVSATSRDRLAQIAGENGISVITNKNEAADLTNITNAYSDLDTMSSTLTGLTSPSPLSRIFNNIGVNPLATALQTSPQKAAASTLQDAGLDLFKAISGIQGFRGNTAVLQQIKDNLPSIYDTSDTASSKLNIVRQLIQNRENAIVSAPTGATSSAAPDAAAQPYSLNGVTYVQGPDGLYYPQSQ